MLVELSIAMERSNVATIYVSREQLKDLMLDFTVAGWKDIEIDEDGEYGCRIFGRRILLRPKFEGELDISKGE